MDKLSFHNPLFSTYAVAACIMILKAVMMSWLTVVRMMQVKGGFRAPDDIKKTILNPNPSSEQLAPNEYVDRIRRIQLNDLENLPFFLVGGSKGPNICGSAAPIAEYPRMRSWAWKSYHDFQQLLDNTRKKLGCSYVQQPTRSVTEITFLLGFSDTSNFTRAFKSWTGLSPTEFRQRALTT